MASKFSPPPLEPRDIQLRAYTTRNAPLQKGASFARGKPTPSDRVLVFDTETTTDEAQSLRFGVYKIFDNSELIETGLFYDEEGLKPEETEALSSFAKRNDFECMSVRDFVEDKFYEECALLHGAIVGFNLPFDLSRLAIQHGTAKSKDRYRLFQHGFSLQLSEDEWTRPRVKVKHLSSRAAFIEFAQPREGYVGKRKKGKPPAKLPSFFVDVRTLAGVLLANSFSLEQLCGALKVATPKQQTDKHGSLLSAQYIEYAVTDVQATWECYVKLKTKLKEHGLSNATPDSLISEASLGKSYLAEMGIKPWQQVQPDFDPVRIGQIMSTYYGGRSEVHRRREILPAFYCDFLSMYPTVNALMGLWTFIISDGMTEDVATDDVRRILENWSPEDLQNPANWKKLHCIVQIMPDDDVLPVRSVYSYGAPRNEAGKSANIAINRLSSPEPLWFTLADCLASKFLHPEHKAPTVVQALRFIPNRPQQTLKPVNLQGNPDNRVDPIEQDFFKRVIELRREVKQRKQHAAEAVEKARLDAEQLALKILANSASYGIFVETLVEDLEKLEELKRYGFDGTEALIKSRVEERPGKYFHPLVATLITGAARLMLALSEWKAKSEKLDWIFCDTDGIAFTPASEFEGDFVPTVQRVMDWFRPLNPYALSSSETEPESILQAEDENFAADIDESGNKPITSLYAYAVSAKRYALFNISENGKVEMRKTSAHGLGQLLPPYDAPKGWKKNSKSDFWHNEVWQTICQSAHDNPETVVNFESDERLNIPAASRYSATTPALVRWFKDQNENAEYSEQVRPFNFLLCFQCQKMELLSASDEQANDWRQKHNSPPRPVAPFDKKPSIAANHAHDRITGEPIPKSWLKTYAQSIAQYHLQDEAKFLGGQKSQTGKLQRRHIEAFAVRHIGKEAHNWEENQFIGAEGDAALRYEDGIFDVKETTKTIEAGLLEFGYRRIADVSNVGDKTIKKIINGDISSFRNQAIRLVRSVFWLRQQALETQRKTDDVVASLRTRADEIGLAALALELGLDQSNLRKMLKRTKPLPTALLEQLA